MYNTCIIHIVLTRISKYVNLVSYLCKDPVYVDQIFHLLMRSLVYIATGSIAAGADGHDLGNQRGFLTRAIFFLGLHETMFFWSKTVVKPVVDDTVFGVARENRLAEKVALAMGFGGLWWWRLRDEVESLVVVVEKKRDLLISIGLVDFVGWWLYYLTVTIGLIKVVKGLIWVVYVMFGRRVVDTDITAGDSVRNDEKV